MFFIFAAMAMWQQAANFWMRTWFAWFSQSNMLFPRRLETYIEEINAVWENSGNIEEQEMACFRIIENIPGLPGDLRTQMQEVLIFTAGQGYLKKFWDECTKTCGQAYA